MNEIYLGDGLYARYDGFTFWLRAPRERGDHEVALEPDVLGAFLEYVYRIRDQERERLLSKARGKSVD